MYEETRRRLGLSRSSFQANAVNYPAVPIQWKLLAGGQPSQYWPSQGAGVTGVRTQTQTIARICPQATIMLMGY